MQKLFTSKKWLSILVVFIFLIMCVFNLYLIRPKNLTLTKFLSVIQPSLTITLSLFSFIITMFISNNLANIRDELEQKEKVEKYKKDEEKLNKDELIKHYKDFHKSLNSILEEKQKISEETFDCYKVEEEIRRCNDFIAKLENYLINELEFYYKKVDNEKKDMDIILNCIESFADIEKLKKIENIDHRSLVKFERFIELVFKNNNDDVSQVMEEDRKDEEQVNSKLNEKLAREGKRK